MKVLLEKGAELMSKNNEYSRTPLWRAGGNGNEVVMKLLLGKSAELESKDNYGQTLLWWLVVGRERARCCSEAIA